MVQAHRRKLFHAQLRTNVCRGCSGDQRSWSCKARFWPGRLSADLCKRCRMVSVPGGEVVLAVCCMPSGCAWGWTSGLHVMVCCADQAMFLEHVAGAGFRSLQQQACLLACSTAEGYHVLYQYELHGTCMLAC